MRNRHLILSLTLATSLPFATTQAAPANLPETGQISCYDTVGFRIDCAGTGQDGDTRAGVSLPERRFTVGTGVTQDCVTDNLTGLMWVKAPSKAHDFWMSALNFTNNLTLCGFTNWRLPNLNELESLVSSEVANQATLLNAQGFTGILAQFYWSSTTAGHPSKAWSVSMLDGDLYAHDKTGRGHIWPVRTGK